LASQTKSLAQPTTTPPVLTRPQWPRLVPLVPAEDLQLEVLLDNQIVLLRNFFTSRLSNDYVKFLSSLPLATFQPKPKKDEAVRKNDRFQIDDAAFAEQIWSSTSLKDLVTAGTETIDWGGEVVGLNPNIRIYR
jgi:hypothetical protein